MAPLKLSNPFRRNPLRPSLRERAAALRASAVRVINAGAIEAPELVQAKVSAAVATPDPVLASMVTKWMKIRDTVESGKGPEEDEEADVLHRCWVDLQLEIYRFPAATIADLQAKALVFVDEVEALKGNGWASSRDLPATAWRGVLADIGRLAGTARSVAMAAPIKSSLGMPAIDLKGLSLSDLRRLHEVAELIGNLGSAVLCQPRCLGEGRPQRPAPGAFAEWITVACETVQGDCEEEARRRVGAADRCDRERLCILADATVENGDPVEIRAFVRDLAESV